MKQFFEKIIFYFIICYLFISFILVKHGGAIDTFYEKFTTPNVSSMIIGDSRSLEGIKPSIINTKLNNSGFEFPAYNYSFTIAQAPIGPLYRKSILKKLNPDTKNGLFIISLSPLMLVSNNDNNNYHYEFTEANQPPHNMSFVNMNPNYEYLLKNFNYFHFKAIFRKKLVLHKDGWLEDNNLPKTTADYDSRMKTWLNSYQNFTSKYSISKYRLMSLDTLVRKLKTYGKVYIVRMPVDKDFLPLEDIIYPKFDTIIDSLAKMNNLKYYSYANENAIKPFKTLDGVHLNKYSSTLFTEHLCDSILKNLKN